MTMTDDELRRSLVTVILKYERYDGDTIDDNELTIFLHDFENGRLHNSENPAAIGLAEVYGLAQLMIDYLRPIIARDVLEWLGDVTQLAAFKDHLIDSYVNLYLATRGGK